MKFDIVLQTRTESKLMSDRRITVFLTLALVAALATSALASCISERDKSDGEMACCIKSQHDCGPAGKAMSCCKTERPTEQRASVAKQEVVSAPARCNIAPATAEIAANQLIPIQRFEFSPHPITSRSAPTYLLDSAFLI